jgi:hypothetical protein
VVLVAWIECESCGRIEKPAHEFNYPADIAGGMQLFVWIPCEQLSSAGARRSYTSGGS